MSPFITQFLIPTASGLIAALLAAFISPRWIKPPESPVPKASPTNGSGAQSGGINAISTGDNSPIKIRSKDDHSIHNSSTDTVSTCAGPGNASMDSPPTGLEAQSGGVNVISRGQDSSIDIRIKDDHSVRDKSTTTTTTNVNAPTASQSDSAATVVGSFIGGVLVASFFLVSWRVVQAAILGIALTIAVMLVVAIVRTARAPEKYPHRTVPAGLFSAISCATAALCAIRLSFPSRDGTTLGSIMASAGQMSEQQRATGLVGFIDYFAHDIVPVLLGGHLVFVVFQAAASIFSVAVLLVCRKWILQWHCFLQYSVGVPLPKRQRKGAKLFRDGKGGYLVGVIIGIVLTLAVCGLGYIGWPTLLR